MAALALTDAHRHELIATAILVAGAAIGFALVQLAVALADRYAKRGHQTIALIVGRARGPLSFVVPFAIVDALLPAINLSERAQTWAEHALGIAIIIAIAWIVVAVVQLFSDLAQHRFDIVEAGEIHIRQVRTRIEILERLTIAVVLFVSTAAILMTFPPIRALGATLLASAGLIGIAAGVAARPIFENLVAGVQIALTQPIRIDDGIVVEKEFGRVEKIGPTFIVVRLWDLRRVVVPLTYFINTPFENWTYEDTNLVGSVMLYFDHAISLDALREELSRVLADTTLWDGKTEKLAMTDAREGSIQVRILVSARNASELFDLRCFVRERMVGFVRDEFPASLPSTRVVLDRGNWDAAAPDVTPEPARNSASSSSDP